jgi:precorrin-3B synthase
MNANPPRRRGACPGLTAPMQTGDGLLVRLAGSGATMGLDAATALCAAARRHGNGIIEITARGSIQIRGLTATSASAFADAVAALGIDAGDGVPVLTDPLAGLAPEPAVDAREVAAMLRQQLAAAPFTTRLGPKVSVVIDGGSALHLDAVRADVRLRAGSGFAGWHVGLGGDAASATPIGAVAYTNAVDAVVRLLATLAQHGPQARTHDLIRQHGSEAFRTAITDLLIETPGPAPRPASDPIGAHSLPDGRWGLGVGLAFGHADADALESLIEAAGRAGASGLRTAPERALLVVGLAVDTAPTLALHAESLGFITRRGDARRHVVACAGAPICASAEIPARTLAPLISRAAVGLLDGALTVHVSGCSKGCAHPGPAGLAIVGDPIGCGLVVGGAARDRPVANLATADVPAAFGLIAREVARNRRPGETSADTLGRLGAARLAAVLGAARHE